MNIQSGFHKVGDEDIYFEKSIIPGKLCQTLVLHGAGKSDITRMSALRESLFERGVPTLALDFSGHGQSTGNESGSIEKRIFEARELGCRLLDTTEDLQVIGFSMSGEVAIRLTQHFRIRNLVLFAPGIYHKDVISIPFGESFSQIIRKHESWRNHDISKILEEYRGSLFLLTPEYDDVIPEGVNEEIMAIAPKAYKKRIVIPGAPHMVGKWMNENPEKVPQIIQELHMHIF